MMMAESPILDRSYRLQRTSLFIEIITKENDKKGRFWTKHKAAVGCRHGQPQQLFDRHEY